MLGLERFFANTKERDTRIGALAAALAAEDQAATSALLAQVIESDGADKNIPPVVASTLRTMKGWKNRLPAFNAAVLVASNGSGDMQKSAAEMAMDLTADLLRVDPTAVVRGLSSILEYAPEKSPWITRAADQQLDIARRSSNVRLSCDALKAVASHAPEGSSQKSAAITGLLNTVKAQKESNFDLALEAAKHAVGAAPADSTQRKEASAALIELVKTIKDADSRRAFAELKSAVELIGDGDKDNTVSTLIEMAHGLRESNRDFAFEISEYAWKNSTEGSDAEEKAAADIIDLARMQSAADPAYAVKTYKYVIEEVNVDSAVASAYAALFELAQKQTQSDPQSAYDVLSYIRDKSDAGGDEEEKSRNGIIDMAKARKDADPGFAFDILKELIENTEDDDDVFDNSNEVLIAMAKAAASSNPDLSQKILSFITETFDSDSDAYSTAIEAKLELAKAQKQSNPELAFEKLKEVIEASEDDDILDQSTSELFEMAKFQATDKPEFAYDILSYIQETFDSDGDEQPRALSGIVALAAAQRESDPGYAFDKLKEVIEAGPDDDVFAEAHKEIMTLARQQIGTDNEFAAEILEFVIDNTSEDTDERNDTLLAYVELARAQKSADTSAAFETLKKIQENWQSDHAETMAEMIAVASETGKNNPSLAREIYEYIADNISDEDKIAEAVSALVDLAAAGKTADPGESLDALDFALNHSPGEAAKTKALAEAFALAKSLQSPNPKLALRAATLVGEFEDVSTGQAKEAQAIVAALNIPAPGRIPEDVDINKYLAAAKPMSPDQFKARFP